MGGVAYKEIKKIAQPCGFCYPHLSRESPQIEIAKIRIFAKTQGKFCATMELSEGTGLSSQTGYKATSTKPTEVIMTKKELAMMEELMATVKALNKRIGELEKRNTVKTTTTTPKTTKAPKASKAPATVGNLVFDGKYVKTGTGFMSSKARYAIRMRAEELGAVKLAKGNPVFDKCHKADKYVQVYEFKTVADCNKFRKEQETRVGK